MVLTPSQVSSGPIECVYTHSRGSQDSKHMAKPTHEWPLAILCLQPAVPKMPCTFPGPTIPLLFERLFLTPFSHSPPLSFQNTPPQLFSWFPHLDRVPYACNSHSAHLPCVRLFPYLSPESFMRTGNESCFLYTHSAWHMFWQWVNTVKIYFD